MNIITITADINIDPDEMLQDMADAGMTGQDMIEFILDDPKWFLTDAADISLEKLKKMIANELAEREEE